MAAGRSNIALFDVVLNVVLPDRLPKLSLDFIPQILYTKIRKDVKMIWIRILMFIAISNFAIASIRVFLGIQAKKDKMLQRAVHGAIGVICNFLGLLSILVAIGAI